MATFDPKKELAALRGEGDKQDQLVADYESKQGVDVDQEPRSYGGGGFLDALAGGAKNAAGAVGSTFDVYTGDKKELVEDANTPPAQTGDQQRFMQALERQKEDDTPEEDQSIWANIKQGIGNVAGAVGEEPIGAIHEIGAQLPNSGVVLAGMAAGAKAGAKAGALAGPKGAGIGLIVGGIVGMFAGNTAIETGFIGQQEAREKGEDVDLGKVAKQGATKGAVITGIDSLTMGANRLMMGAPGRAVGKAVEKVLRKNKVDPANVPVMRIALRDDPDLLKEVMEVGKSAYIAALPGAARRIAEKTAGMGLETVSEGAGEYLGSKAAGLEADFTEAVMEGMLSLPQSATELLAVSSRQAKKDNDLNRIMAKYDRAPWEQSRAGEDIIPPSRAVDQGEGIDVEAEIEPGTTYPDTPIGDLAKKFDDIKRGQDELRNPPPPSGFPEVDENTPVEEIDVEADPLEGQRREILQDLQERRDEIRQARYRAQEAGDADTVEYLDKVAERIDSQKKDLKTKLGLPLDIEEEMAPEWKGREAPAEEEGGIEGSTPAPTEKPETPAEAEPEGTPTGEAAQPPESSTDVETSVPPVENEPVPPTETSPVPPVETEPTETPEAEKDPVQQILDRANEERQARQDLRRRRAEARQKYIADLDGAQTDAERKAIEAAYIRQEAEFDKEEASIGERYPLKDIAKGIEERAPETAEDEIRPKTGKPFRSEASARNALKIRKLEGKYEPVEVEGGWVLKKIPEGQTTTEPAPETTQPAEGTDETEGTPETETEGEAEAQPQQEPPKPAPVKATGDYSDIGITEEDADLIVISEEYDNAEGDGTTTVSESAKTVIERARKRIRVLNELANCIQS